MNLYDDNPTILRGVPQVIAAISEIDDLRRTAGQQDDLSTDLHLILSRHNSLHRRPIVVLLRVSGVARAAVIFAERCVLGVGIGLLRTGDQVGDGAVIADESERKLALLVGMDILLKQWRCHTVAATLSGITTDPYDLPTKNRLAIEISRRSVRRYLPLSSTLAETLRNRFSLKKRKNLLYYRRRLLKTCAVEFVPRIPTSEIQSALMELSHHTWPHRTPAEIAHHCEFLIRHPECFAMGIRLDTGVWLSIITGWRVNGITYMPWQLNHDDYKDKSLMQVMRTYLLEHECNSGQVALNWVGGTVAFQNACNPEFCLDIVKARRGLRTTVLRNFVAPILFKLNPDGFIGGSLMLLLPARSRGTLDSGLDPVT